MNTLSAVKYRNYKSTKELKKDIIVTDFEIDTAEIVSPERRLVKDGIPDLQSVKRELGLDMYTLNDKGQFTLSVESMYTIYFIYI